MSSLRPGYETNIGLAFRMLKDVPGVRLHYEPGIQWRGLAHAHEVMAGVGINRQIKRAYRFLAEGYEAGDKIVLMGYSRGAYAIRSLAGLIDRMGLIRAEDLTDQTMEQVYNLYREAPNSPRAREVRDTLCHSDVPIDFIGAYDTVRALGIRWPLIWRFLPMPQPFHSHGLGAHVRVARHALALNETRVAYAPILWNTHYSAQDRDVEQMWFSGTHGDIGGQVPGADASRARTNISLVWMLNAAEKAGLPMPDGWEMGLEQDPNAPSVGNFRGFGKLFLTRRRRLVGADPSERIHWSVHKDSRGMDEVQAPSEPPVASPDPAR